MTTKHYKTTIHKLITPDAIPPLAAQFQPSEGEEGEFIPGSADCPSGESVLRVKQSFKQPLNLALGERSSFIRRPRASTEETTAKAP
ncbi:hypothetical protein KUCAC02_013256 [Chaenocephalus aceratus]|nr:hypothetical protein KUCAC02_013256 [Chaenocephalus aceratus]